MDVGKWLQSLGFQEHAAAFEENGVDAALLRELTNEDLKDLGVTRLAERKRLLKAISDLSALTDDTLGRGSAAEYLQSAERRQLTVMFCDLVGSTELSTRLDPEDFAGVIGSYQETCARAVAQRGGTVAKFMGDGVLVYFGYPRAHEDDAEQAVHAGLDVTDAVAALRAADTNLQARVGIATGLVVVGETIGDGAAQEQAVAGEAPNLAARLQALAEPGTVVVSETTQRLTGRRFEALDLGHHRLKGFAESVRAWRVTAIHTDASRFEAMRADESLTPLVGRERELDLILQCWRKARTGQGQVILLSGEPGIGKSRIAEALQVHLADEPHIRLRYNCSPQHANSAFFPIISHLEAAARFERDDTSDRKLDKLEALLAQSSADATAVASLFAALLSLPGADRYGPIELDAKGQKEATFAALADQLDRLSANDPLAMYLEDAQWIDPTTLELFERLVGRISSVPILLVVMFRPDFDVPWARDDNVHRVALERLGPAQVTRVIEGVTGGRGLPEDVVAEIVAKTDGVPLFVEELTKSLLESGLLYDDGTQFVAKGPLRDLKVPATLQESLLARLDRLASVKEVAQVGAALGRDFSHAVLAAVLEAAEPELRDAMVQLEDAGLLFRRGRPPEANYRFKHALVQDAAYQSMLRSHRTHLHKRIAAVLQDRFADTADAAPDQLAHHLTEAGETDAAIAAWRRAARRAIDMAADVEAAVHLRRALELLQSVPAGLEHDSMELDLRIELGQALMATIGPPAQETEQNFERALALCDKVGATRRMFPVLYGSWAVMYVSGQVSRSQELAGKFLRLAERQDDLGALAVANRITGTAQLMCGSPNEARPHLERVLELYDPDRHAPLAKLYGQDIGVTGLCGLSLDLWYLGQTDQARAHGEAAIERARQLRHTNTLAYALGHCACTLPLSNRDWETAERGATELLRLGNDHDMMLWQLLGGASVAAARAQQDPGAARNEELERAIRVLADQIQFGLWKPLFLCWLAEAQAAVGQVAEGFATLDEAQDRIDQHGEAWALPELHRLRGILHLNGRQDDQVRAEACFRDAVEAAKEMDARIYELRAATNLARLLGEQDRTTDARDVLAPVYEAFAEGHGQRDLRAAKIVLNGLS